MSTCQRIPFIIDHRSSRTNGIIGSKKNNSSKINKLLQLEMVDVSIFPLIKEPVAYGALGNKFFLMIQSSP